MGAAGFYHDYRRERHPLWFIEKCIEEQAKLYDIREIAVDRWNATQMIQNLEDDGFTMVPFGQGYKDMSPPSKELFKLLMEGTSFMAATRS